MMGFRNDSVCRCSDGIWDGDYNDRLRRADSVWVPNCLDDASRDGQQRWRHRVLV